MMERATMQKIDSWITTSGGVIASFAMTHMQTIQAFITFLLTAMYLIYKIKEVKLNATLKKIEVERHAERRTKKN